MTKPDPSKDKQQNESVQEPDELDDSIDTLEFIISSQVATTDSEESLDIPVLDDIVEEGHDDDSPDDEMINTGERKYGTEPGRVIPANAELVQDNIEALLEMVDEKLAVELDSLLELLKDAIKDSVITELRLQLQSKAAKSASDPEDGQ